MGGGRGGGRGGIGGGRGGGGGGGGGGRGGGRGGGGGVGGGGGRRERGRGRKKTLQAWRHLANITEITHRHSRWRFRSGFASRRKLHTIILVLELTHNTILTSYTNRIASHAPYMCVGSSVAIGPVRFSAIGCGSVHLYMSYVMTVKSMG